MSKIYFGEVGYLELLSDILHKGVNIPDRTGVGSVALFDAKIVWDRFPFFTHRPVHQRPAFEELWFMLRGETQTKKLEEVGVNFWKGNTNREFLNSRNLNHLEEGDMGKAYGWQWRQFGAGEQDFGYDQLTCLLDELKSNRYSRRHLISLWNPAQSHEMALTPCWYGSQFVILPENGKDVLHLKLINRSLDAPFGLVYAVQQYRLLQIAIARLLGVKVGKLSCDLTHVHIYENQLNWAAETIEREHIVDHCNKVELTKWIGSTQDLLEIQWSDWKVDYKEYNNLNYSTPKPMMAA